MNTFEQAYQKSIESICFSTEEKVALCSRLEKAAALQRKGDGQMEKKKAIPRAAILVAILILATAATVFAAGKVRSIASRSWSSYDYTTPEEINTALEEAGMKMLPETLREGFGMDGGNIVANEGMDEEDAIVDTWESISVTYKDADDRSLYIEASCYGGMYEDRSSWPEATETKTIKGIEIRYDHSEHFMVPPDYEVDEETKERAEKDFHFAIGYGTDEPKTMFFDTIQFTMGGADYVVYSSDGVSGEELFSIAEQLI